MKKFFLFICLITLSILFGCSKSNDVERNPEKDSEKGNENIVEEEKSAYEKLNSEEKSIYSCIVSELEYFKDPSSVKIVVVGEFWNAILDIKITAKNSLGEKVTHSALYAYKNISITNKDMALYSSAATNSYGEIVNPDKIVGVISKGDFAMYEYVKYLNDNMTPGWRDIGIYRVTYCLIRFQTKVSDKLTMSINSALINQALTEYKEQKGWI